jgi:hypothetical protein
MLRLFFGRHLGPEACRSLVLEARADAERRQAHYEAIRHELELDEDRVGDRPYWLLTLSAGEYTARGAIAWADEAIAALEGLEASIDAPKRRRR